MTTRTRRTGLGLVVVAALATAAAAQDLGIKAPPQRGRIAVVHGTVHPVSSPPIERGYVVFENGRITGVGSGEYAGGGSGVTVIDASGRHVYPGMIAPVTQLGLTEIGMVRATVDIDETGQITPEVRACVGVNPDTTLIPVTRTNGILAAGVFPSGGLIPGRASVIRFDGWTWEDMTVKADAGLVVNYPQVRPIQARWMDLPEDRQRDSTRRSLDALDEAFASAEAYAAGRARDAGLPTDLRWEAMRGVLPGAGEGAGGQLPVFVEAQDFDQITTAVAWGAKRGLKVVIVGGRDAPMASELLKQHNVSVVVRGIHGFPKRNDSPYDAAFTLPSRLEAAGVRFCIASDDDTAHERNLPYVAAMAAAHGLSPESALRAVTLSAAEVLGVSGELGSLDAGKSATLFIADGNPLEVTTRVERAFIDGREIDLENKHTQLRDKYREKYRQLNAGE